MIVYIYIYCQLTLRSRDVYTNENLLYFEVHECGIPNNSNCSIYHYLGNQSRYNQFPTKKCIVGQRELELG